MSKTLYSRVRGKYGGGIGLRLLRKMRIINKQIKEIKAVKANTSVFINASQFSFKSLKLTFISI